MKQRDGGVGVVDSWDRRHKGQKAECDKRTGDFRAGGRS